MFIHIGGDTMVRLREIIGIFDIHMQSSAESSPLFERAYENRSICMIETPGGEPKSIVITDGHVYLSPISSLTLKKRAAHIFREEEDTEMPDAIL